MTERNEQLAKPGYCGSRFRSNAIPAAEAACTLASGHGGPHENTSTGVRESAYTASARAALEDECREFDHAEPTNREIAAEHFANDGKETRIVGKHQIRVPAKGRDVGMAVAQGETRPIREVLAEQKRNHNAQSKALREEAFRVRAGMQAMLMSCLCCYPLVKAETESEHASWCPAHGMHLSRKAAEERRQAL